MRTAKCLSSHRRPDGGVKVASPPKLQQRHHLCARSPIQARTGWLLDSFQSSCCLRHDHSKGPKFIVATKNVFFLGTLS